MYGTTPLKMRPERFNQEVPLRQQNPTYAAMVENVDTNVGKVIDALDELGVTKDTIIVFTSDNGGSCMPKSRPTSNYPLRASKGWNYEGGIRIPTFITWPGSISAAMKIIRTCHYDGYLPHASGVDRVQATARSRPWTDALSFH